MSRQLNETKVESTQQPILISAKCTQKPIVSLFSPPSQQKAVVFSNKISSSPNNVRTGTSSLDNEIKKSIQGALKKHEAVETVRVISNEEMTRDLKASTYLNVNKGLVDGFNEPKSPMSKTLKSLKSLSVDEKFIDLTSVKKANLPIIFIVGGPGSGKGTQCERMVAKYGLTHLSSGDLLRAEIKSGSELGLSLTQIMSEGKLVALETVLDLIKQAMVKAVERGSKGFLIDGYPREIKQGEQFESEIYPSKLVFFFDVSEDTLVKRCLKRAETSGRSDDNIETITKRLRTYNESTTPVVQHYKNQNKLVHIKAEGTIDDIFEEVSKHVDRLIN